MGFLKKVINSVFGGGNGEVRDPDGIYLYIKCDRCGAPVRVRADKRHDLQQDYDTGGYILRKEVMDGGCFTLVRTTTRFDAVYRIVDQQIEGGDFISCEEYRNLTAPARSLPEKSRPPSETP
ncbi:MAG: hypothetical protein MUQ30_15495 [Anaerolineae bacterium]|nr:hypothetical protein [Anaerolineae bacterium]